MEEEEQQEQQQEEAESVEHQYMCSECQQLFNTLEDVLLHQRIHTGAEADGEVEVVEGVLAEEQSQTYQCLECGALIVTSEDLLQHQEMHMREVEQPVLTEVLETQTGQPEAQLSAGVQYQCLDCLALFDSPDAWLAHRRIHSRSSTHSNTESVEYMIQPNGTLTPLNSTQNYLLSEQQAGEILAQVLAQQQRQEPKKSRPFSKAAAASRSALLPPVTPAPGSATMHLQILTAQVLADSSPPPGQQHAKMAQGPAAKPGALENGVQRLELRLAPGGVRELQQPAEVVVIHPYECSECSLLFQTPEDFLQHQGEHFLCQDKESAESGVMGGCEETRGREEILGRSEEFRGVENRESVWAKPQKCDLCTRTFNSVNRLAAHKRVHEQGTHECPECGKVFKKATSLQTHQRTHSGVARYLCVDCGHGFTTEMTLIMHRKSHTSDPLHKCQFCNKTFTNMTKYLYHRRIHLNRDAAGPPVVFTDSAPTRVSVSALAILQRARGRKDALEPFLRDQTERAEPERSDPTHDQGEVEKENMEASAPPAEEPKAPSPGKVSAENPANVGATATATDCTVAPVMVQRRLKSQLTGERPFQCSDCGKTFSFLANLMRHNLIHSGVRPYRCDICHRAFSQSSNLRQHSLLHSRAATLRCPDCPSTFRWPTKLAAHRYTRHPGSPAPFTCPHCAAGFLSRRRRDAHCLERHLGQVRAAAGTEVTADPSTSTAAQGGEASVRGGLDCHICGKKLNSAANLRLHKLSHFASGPGRPRSGVAKQSQKCPICGKQFVSSSGVALHQRVHTGERPFPCQVCGKRFRQNTHLREHLRTHSGERPFRCEVCGKAFIQSMHLAEHRRTHTGERPHVCPLCGKAFKTFSNLRNHKKTHARQQRVDQEAEAAAAAPAAAAAAPAAPPQDTMQTAATVTMEASAVEVSEGQPQIIQIQASDIQQCTPTIMCNEFGETIAIIEGGGLPLEQALEIYQRALENGLAVDTVAVEGLRLL